MISPSLGINQKTNFSLTCKEPVSSKAMPFQYYFYYKYPGMNTQYNITNSSISNQFTYIFNLGNIVANQLIEVFCSIKNDLGKSQSIGTRVII